MTTDFAFIFPGQGSQTVGMLRDLAEQYPLVQETYAQASEVLGYDLWDLIQNNPQKLDQTEFTQPAMLAGGYSVWRLWESLTDAKPQLLAGHSLGEYTALVCAKVLSFEDALRLVSLRGRLMQQALPEGSGAMAAIIGLDDDVVMEICAEAAQGKVVSAANFNAIGQVVIGGHRDAVERAVALAEKKEARMTKILPMSAPSHCSLLMDAAQKLAKAFEQVTFNSPEIPFLNNVDVMKVSDPTGIKDALVRQLYNPVQWVKIVQAIAATGITTVVECGPGKVLSGLIKRINRDIDTSSINDPESLEKALALVNS